MKKIGNYFCTLRAMMFLVCAWSALGESAPAWALVNPCYVDGAAMGANDGSTWRNAYTNPQFALLDSSCSEIWVAKGVYKPTFGTDPTISFLVQPRVQMYGGFSGDEVNRDDRLPATNLTILSGDIDNNDANASSSNVDDSFADIRGTNSRHVLVMNGTAGSVGISNSTVLDGFTITGGVANVTGNGFGGGLLCDGSGNGRDDSGIQCSPLLRNLVFSGNAAISGGAVYDDASGMGKSSPTFINVTFHGNHASQNGGAIGNVADNKGQASPSLELVFFSNNDATLGGAFYNRAGTSGDETGTISSPTIKSAMFANNVADTGGAFYNHGLNGGTAAPKFDTATFVSNSTRPTGGPYGGGLFSLGEEAGTSNPTLINSTFTENHAGTGGAIFDGTLSTGNQKLELTNVTISGNSADSGGGIANSAHTGRNIAVLTNVISWGDTAALDSATNEISNAGTTLLVSYGVVDNGCPIATDIVCDHIATASPNLAALSENGGYTRTMLPGLGSSAIDAGLDSACPLFDQRGVTRPDGAHCDIGAVEFTPFLPPSAIPLSVIVPQNTSKAITLAGTDANPNGPFTYTFSLATKANHGDLTLFGDTATYTPIKNYTGPDNFTYTATDKNGVSTAARVSITVTAIPPVATPMDVTVPHDTSKTITLSATDSNSNGPFTYIFAVVTTTSHGTLTLAGDVATYTPTSGYTGPDSFTYTAADTNGTSLPALVTIHVGAIPPVAQPRSLVVHKNASGQITFGATDGNLGGPFTYTYATATLPAHGVLSTIEGTLIVYTPNHDYVGTDSFTYTATDANGISVPAMATITVLPVDGSPGSKSVSSTPTLSGIALFVLSGGMITLAVGAFRQIA